MVVDSATGAFLEGMRAAGGKPLFELTVDEARELVRGVSQQLGAPAAQVERIEDRRIAVADGDFGVRIYTPRASEASALPIVLQLHGGGWAAGDLDTHDSIARFYAADAGAIVISVDYRRPPEWKFPTAVDDAYAAVEWASAHAREFGGDAGRIAVTGDSAGGNLAAVVCQLARRRGGPDIVYQALVYPTVDVRDPMFQPAYGSRAQFGGGDYFLSTRDMEWFRSLYLTDVPREMNDPRVSPIAATDLRGLPPALIVTAGCDPLLDEGKAYGDRLADAGVPVEYKCFDRTIHACMSFAAAIPSGLEMLSLVASRLRAALR